MFKIHTCVYVCFDMFHAFQSMVPNSLRMRHPTGRQYPWFPLQLFLPVLSEVFASTSGKGRSF